MHFLDWIVVAAFLSVLVLIAVKARRTRTLDDFTVASRDMPRAIVFATLAATYVGPGFTLGVAGSAAEHGYVWYLISVMTPLQTVLIGKWIAPKLREFSSCHSVGHVMGEIYGPPARLVTGVLSFLFSSFVVGLIARGFGEVVHNFTGIPVATVIIVGTLPVIVYAALGGVKTVILTDAIQFTTLSVSIPLVIVFSGFLFDFQALAAAVPATHLSLQGNYSAMELAGLMASFFFGEMLLPFYCVRALAARSPKDAGEGFMAAGLFGFPWMLVVVTIGIIGGGTVTGVATDAIFLKTMEAYLPVGVLGLVLAGVFGIIMSSQDSCLHSGSVAFSIDIFQHFRPNTPPATLLRYSQFIVGVIGVIAILFALRVPNLIDALLYVYTLWAPTIVPPLLVGLLWRQVPRACGLAGILGGGIGTAVWEWGLSSPYGIPSLVVGILTNLLALSIVAVIQRRKEATR